MEGFEPRTSAEACALSQTVCSALLAAMSPIPGQEGLQAELPVYQRPTFVTLTTGIRVRYLEWGSGPETLILLHDVSESALVWFPIGAHFADLGYHVFALDLRGHGDSARSVDANYSTAVMAEDLHAFILDRDLYVAPVAVVGAGLGGAIALREAANHPQLVGALVLAAFDPAQALDTWFPAQAAVFEDEPQARALFTCPAWGPGVRTLRHMPLALQAMLRPHRGASPHTGASMQLTMKMDSHWLLQHDPKEAQAQLQRVACSILMLLPDGVGLPDEGRRTLQTAVQATSRSFVSLSCASSFVATEASSQVCKALLGFLEGVSGALLPPTDDMPRRPEALGLRPLPAFASLEQAAQALQPRKILSAEQIQAELVKAGVDAAEGHAPNPHQTALTNEPADYFGFIG